MTRLATSSSMAVPDEDDAVLEQARVDVVGALAPVGLLDDVGHRDVGHRSSGAPLGRARLLEVSGGGQQRNDLVLADALAQRLASPRPSAGAGRAARPSRRRGAGSPPARPARPPRSSRPAAMASRSSAAFTVSSACSRMSARMRARSRSSWRMSTPWRASRCAVFSTMASMVRSTSAGGTSKSFFSSAPFTSASRSSASTRRFSRFSRSVADPVAQRRRASPPPRCRPPSRRRRRGPGSSGCAATSA